MRTVALLNAFPSRFRHTVVALDGHREAASRLRAGLPVEVLDAPALPDGVAGIRARAAWLRGTAPDLLLTYNWGAIEWVAAARLARCRRLIHAEDGFGVEEANGQFSRRVWARRLLLRGASRVVVPSAHLREVARRTWWLPARTLLHLDNGIDLAHFAPGAPAEARRRLGLDAAGLVVGSVAGLRKEKSLEHLVRAFAACTRHPDACLVLVGDGPEREALAAVARECGIEARVRFTGAVEDPADLYRAMDVFALCSRTEQMPLSVVEAMATGLPVLATDVGDVRRMVAPENEPFVVPVREQKAFGIALSRLLDDAALRRGLGAANRARAEAHFDFAAMQARYVALYDEVLGQAPAP